MKLSAIPRLLAVFGLAAAAFAQPPAPGTPAPAAPSAPAPTLQAVTPTESTLAPDTVVLTVGNQSITRAQFENLLAALAENGRPAKTADQKRKVAEQYADLQTMVQEARKRKLDEDAQIKQMMSI